jgi:ABC-type transporter Mla MlaB component
MEIQINKDTLFLTPKTDLVASQIERLRDLIWKALKENPNATRTVLKANHIETVDSLGVNLIIGTFRQLESESKIFEITGAGEKFLKVAGFFQFPTLFKVTGKEEMK